MIVREGWLLKRGEHIKNWRARYFVLMEDGSLLGFKQKPTPGQYREPTNNFTVKDCKIIKVESPTHFIFIIKGLSPDQEIERNFSAGNDQDRDSWCKTILETAMKLEQKSEFWQCALGNYESNTSRTTDQDSEMIIANSLTQKINNHDYPISSSNINNGTSLANQCQSKAVNSDASLISLPSKQAHYNFNNITSTSNVTTPLSSTASTTTTIGQCSIFNSQTDPLTSKPFIFEGGNMGYVPQPKKMSLEDFNPIKLIGRGSWGKVMLSREKSTRCLYAIKILKKHVIIAQNEVDHTRTESRVLRTTKHPFLIALKYSFRDGERLCFVMEFAGGGELFYHLSQEKKFSEEKTRFYAAEIVSALGYLHDNDIIYRDLKLENLLLGQDGHIKIADFGLCKDNIRSSDTTRTFCGTPEYLSPEVIEDFHYGRAIDWWSLGVLLYEMMCGSLPFNNKTTDVLFREILLKQVSFPATLSEPAKTFLNGLLIKDPTKRLGGGPEDAREIMIHPFFRGLNWKDLYDKKIPPPFVPEISSETDTRYFDRQFTTEPVNLTPIDRPMNNLSEVDASYFTQFSFAAGSQIGHH